MTDYINEDEFVTTSSTIKEFEEHLNVAHDLGSISVYGGRQYYRILIVPISMGNTSDRLRV